MLTHEDLQAIQSVIQKELRKELVPIKKKLKKIDKIEKDLMTAIHLFDNEHHELEERVVRLEDVVF